MVKIIYHSHSFLAAFLPLCLAFFPPPPELRCRKLFSLRSDTRDEMWRRKKNKITARFDHLIVMEIYGELITIPWGVGGNVNELKWNERR